jgi:hypothetical protein
MDANNRGSDFPGRTELNMEDYGHDDSDPSLTREEGAGTATGRESGAEQSNVGGHSGGTEGAHSGGHEGEMFGEFENSDTGTDLTVEMMNTDARESLTEEEAPGE